MSKKKAVFKGIGRLFKKTGKGAYKIANFSGKAAYKTGKHGTKAARKTMRGGIGAAKFGHKAVRSARSELKTARRKDSNFNKTARALKAFGRGITFLQREVVYPVANVVGSKYHAAKASVRAKEARRIAAFDKETRFLTKADKAALEYYKKNFHGPFKPTGQKPGPGPQTKAKVIKSKFTGATYVVDSKGRTKKHY